MKLHLDSRPEARPTTTIERDPVAAVDVAGLTNLLPRGSRGADAATTTADRRSEIETVIAEGGPSIVFQPVVHLESATVIGVEALSRFPGPRSTSEWFDRAAQCGLGVDLEISAADATLRRLQPAMWRDLEGYFVGLNVSLSALVDDRFRELLMGAPCDHLILELTLRQGTVGAGAARARLELLRSWGVRVAVNSMRCAPQDVAQAIAVEPEIIKLGTDFTAALVRDDARYDEARAVLDDCRRHGVFVVAVGVEHPREIAALRRIGVDAAQGHVFGRLGS